MSCGDYIYYSSEIFEFSYMLDRMPKERVIDRKSLEYRLEEAGSDRRFGNRFFWL
ncbi:MAG: hypothetical protein LBU13_02795 [Synergistaceae bacterium]|nr:hypothetical protein [Synergistaceae bacterium]